MTDIIAGFICALVLAALVVAWLTYCLFFKEKHKSESIQYGISDLQHKNYQIAQDHQEEDEKKEMKKDITAGIFILPSRRKQKEDEYVQRPDYPESPARNMHSGDKKIVEIFSENAVDADVHTTRDIFDVDCHSPSGFQSDV